MDDIWSRLAVFFLFFFQSLKLPLFYTSLFCRCQIHCEPVNSQRKKKLALALFLQRPAVSGVNSGISKGRSLFLCGLRYHAYGAWARCHYPYIGRSFLGILDESKAVLSLEGLSQNTSKPGNRLCAVSGFTTGQFDFLFSNTKVTILCPPDERTPGQGVNAPSWPTWYITLSVQAMQAPDLHSHWYKKLFLIRSPPNLSLTLIDNQYP